MSRLSQIAEEYLKLRASLGHELALDRRLLPDLVAYLDGVGAGTVTIDLALAWSLRPNDPPTSTMPPRRMTIARSFARHMASFDDRTEVPPAGLLSSRRHWRPPFLYSNADIEALVAQARAIRWRLPAATYATLIGLLAATGMRVGEAVRLDRADIDWPQGVLMVRRSKFNKSRLVPVSTSAVEALHNYADTRDRLCGRPSTPSFFVSVRGGRLAYGVVSQVFQHLIEDTRVGQGPPRHPTIHGLRHTFAVRALQHWYETGEDVEARMPSLSTYMGHRDPRYTYWYLSAAPELLALAAHRLDTNGRAPK